MKLLLTIVLIILTAVLAKAQPVQLVSPEKINPELITNHWKAQWITHPTESALDYGVFQFRSVTRKLCK